MMAEFCLSFESHSELHGRFGLAGAISKSMARRKSPISEPHPHRFRITRNKSYIYVAGQQAANKVAGKKECITWRCYVHVPVNVEGKIGLARTAVYGGTSDECRQKAETLVRSNPVVLDVNLNQARFGLEAIAAKDLAWALKTHENSETSLASAIKRAKSAALPTVRQLADQAIARKLVRDKNVVSDRAHLSKLDAPIFHKDGKFRLGRLKVDEVTQSHLVAWVKMVTQMPGRMPGTTLSEHSVELAIALVKLAWSELLHDEEQAKCFEALRFDTLASLFRKATPREVDRRLLDLDKLLLVADCARTPKEAGVMALLLMGVRMNEVGAVRWEDISTDEEGRLWVEPVGSISASRRKWRPRTKPGWRENRALPVCEYQRQMLDFAKVEGSEYVCGSSTCSTSDVGDVYWSLSERAGVAWTDGDHCKFIRHTVLSTVSDVAGELVAEMWGHQKHRDTMLSRVYDLRQVRAKRKAARRNLYVDGICASELLPWALRTFPGAESKSG
jgi:integrase